MSAPTAMTMDRLGETKQLILAQSTNQCCRFCCCQPSFNWVLREADNFKGGNPHDEPNAAWIHEESEWSQRCCIPYCRAAKYVQHSSAIPDAVMKEEDGNWCSMQREDFPKGLTEEDRNKDIIATHEKPKSCGANCCCFLPYMETKNANGEVIGKTEFVCDSNCFVPKYDVFDAQGQKKYRVRPDTCVGGACVRCRCGGEQGKCFMIPAIVRDPKTYEPLKGNDGKDNAQLTLLWAGLANAFCTQRDAFHVVYPDNASPEDKLILTGSTILIDLLQVEHQDSGN